jgi:hypothetical protein
VRFESEPRSEQDRELRKGKVSDLIIKLKLVYKLFNFLVTLSSSGDANTFCSNMVSVSIVWAFDTKLTLQIKFVQSHTSLVVF